MKQLNEGQRLFIEELINTQKILKLQQNYDIIGKLLDSKFDINDIQIGAVELNNEMNKRVTLKKSKGLHESLNLVVAGPEIKAKTTQQTKSSKQVNQLYQMLKNDPSNCVNCLFLQKLLINTLENFTKIIQNLT